MRNSISLRTLVFSILYVSSWSSIMHAAGPRMVDSMVRTENLRSAVAALSSIPSRVVGYDSLPGQGGPSGMSRSAEWVTGTFNSLGLSNVRQEAFEVTVPVERGSKISLPRYGIDLPLHSFWPNFIRTSQTPRKGITGNLIYCQKGELKSFNGKVVVGSIVALDMDCGASWFNAMLLGARAIIFIESPMILRGEAESKFLNTPADIPRFYVDRATGEKLKQFAGKATANVKCEMRWQRRTAVNVLGEIPGSDAKLSKEWIILEAYYDTMSVVPGIAPGAESATGIASMLETVRILKQLQPKRSILVLATSGHFEALAGIREFFEQRQPPGATPNQKKEFAKFKAFISFELTSQSKVFGTFYKAHFIDQPENQLQWKFADIGTLMRETAQKVAPRIGLPKDAYVDGINPIQGKNWRTFLPAALATDNEVANLEALPGLALITANDARLWVNTPHDTLDRVNFANLTRQVKLAVCILPALIDSDNKDLFNLKLDNGFARASGMLAEFDPRRSFIPDQPISGSLAVLHSLQAGPKVYSGVQGNFIDLTPTREEDKTTKGKKKEGMFKFVGIAGAGQKPIDWRVDGFDLDPDSGDITMTNDRGSNGEEVFPAQFRTDVADKKLTLVLFKCKSMTIYDMVDQRQFALLGQIYIFDSRREAQPYEFGYFLPQISFMSAVSASIYEPVAIVFVKPRMHIKVTMGADLLGLRFVLINASGRNPLGEGFNIDTTPTIPYTPWFVANDMWKLDDSRIRSLRTHGIENDRVDKLHKDAYDLLREAKRALDAKLYDVFLSDVRAAWSFESRAYPDVQKMANDVVKGIMFYLALLLPFAFFAERLFFSFPDIRKQIVGASALFIAIFLVIRCVHPAFAIATTPWIILLAFIILALTAIVSSILVQKFEDEMRKMKLETGAIHATDVGRLSATAAAFNLGIANMRRRKARTTLTCITLILLTFTVLSFTSVVTQTRIRQLLLKYTAPYNGIMIRQHSWIAMGEPMVRIVRNEFGAEHPVAPRAWYLSALVGDRSFVTITHGSESYAANALVGLAPEENQITDVSRSLAGRWFTKDDVLACIVPSQMAQQLGLTEADIGKTSLEVLGANLKVIGILDADRLKDTHDLDGELVTPVDYTLMQKERRQQSQQTQAGELEEYIHMVPDAVLFVPYEFVILHGGNLESIAIGMQDGHTVQEKLKGLMERIELNVYAGVDGKTYLCSALAQTKPVGVADLLVPIAIVALIVLNTMLGSVFERTNEIGIFGSLGLAPVHISALFIAEACVYAVLGAISGYVFGQVLSKLIVDYHLARGLNLNYSSLSTVGSTLVVMLTVLLSTLYPARKAAEMSVPDVQRRWKLPDPEGDFLKAGLPFTVSSAQSLGINMFLQQFFEAHTDYSVGNFSTANVSLEPFDHERGPAYRLQVMLWLAPYDLGVSEHMTLETTPTDDPWVNVVMITIHRESGDQTSWLRVTRNFLNNLRRQFLIWRTCTPEVKAQFQRRGEEELQKTTTVNG